MIAAGESASGPQELACGVRELIDAAGEILVVTPTLASRLEWPASATDKAREQADERFRTALDQLAERGSEASGAVGADDSLLAFEGAIRELDPDDILIALRAASTPAGRSGGW